MPRPPSSRPLVAGVDLATADVRVAVADGSGEVVARASAPLAPPQQPEPGVSEQDAGSWWPAVVDSLRRALAEAGGEVVGFVAVHVMPRFEHGDRICRVLALVVDSGVRERGVGHQLMSEAEAVAESTGCAFIEVTAGHHRAEAMQLYQSLGYETGVTTYLRKRLSAG
jgi:ribosomal protein S18 acetylase RimI-like enzyme